MTSSFYGIGRASRPGGRAAPLAAALLGCALLGCAREPASSAGAAPAETGAFTLSAEQQRLRAWTPPAGGDWVPRWIEHLKAGSREGQRFALQELRLAGPAAGPALAAELRAISGQPDRFGLAINLVSALGACGAAAEWEAVADLLLHHPTPVVRTTAGEAAAQLRAPELLPALQECLERETEAGPRRAALTAIARIGGDAAVLDLEARVRAWIASAGSGASGGDGGDSWNALMLVDGPELLPALLRLDPLLPPPLRVQALTARLEMGDREVGPELRGYLDSAVYPSVKTRQLALSALSELGDWDAVLGAAQDPDPGVQAAVARLLGTPGAVAAGAGVDLLDGWLTSGDPELERAALVSLVAHGQRHRLDPWLLLLREFPLRSGSTEALLLLTRDPLLDPRLPGVLIGCWPQAAGEHRMDLMRALTKTGSPEGAALIERAMLDPREEPEVRRLAATLIANFPSCVAPLVRWYDQEPGAARAADLAAGLGRHRESEAARGGLLFLASDETAPDAARKVVLDVLPQIYGVEACEMYQQLRAATKRADVRAYLDFLLASWF